MTFFIRSHLTILLIVICATCSVDARTRHRTPKRTEPPVVTAGAKATVETKRDPADIALDRKIKGICKGC